MSHPKDDYIKQLEAHNEKLEKVIQQKNSEIKNLNQELITLRASHRSNDRIAGVLNTSFQDVIDTIREMDLEIEYKNNLLSHLLNRYGRVDQHVSPQVYTDQPTKVQLFLDKLNEPEEENLTLTATKQHVVCASVTLASDPYTDEMVIISNVGVNWNTDLDKFIEEVGPRTHAMMWQLPTLDHLRYDTIAGVEQEQLLKAVQQVALFWHDDKLREFYFDRIDEVFNTEIVPYIDEYKRDEARKKFREMIPKTMAQLSNIRQTVRRDKPKGQAGRRPKKITPMLGTISED